MPCETEFIRRRRRALSGCKIEDADAILAEAVAASQLDQAGATVQSEQLFQKTKAFKNLVQGYIDGHLILGEVPADMQAVAQAFVEHQGENHRKLTLQHKRKHELMATKMPCLENRKIYVADPAWATLPEVSSRRYRFVTEDQLSTSQVFVVKDAAKPGLSVRWTATLSGGSVIDLSMLKAVAAQSDRMKGVCFNYDAAVTVKRRFFMCPRFEAAKPRIAAVVRAAVNSRSSRWKFFQNWEEFAAATEKAIGPRVPARQRRPFDNIALTVPEVRDALELPNVFTVDTLLPKIAQIGCASRGV